MTTPSVPEVPHADGVLAHVTIDLESSRAVVQRFTTAQDALLAAEMAIIGVLVTVAFASGSAAPALVASIISLVFVVVDARTGVLLSRTTNRIERLEQLVQAHVRVLREPQGPARATEVQDLRDEIDRYQYGAESALDPADLSGMWKFNHGRIRWWAHPALTGVAIVLAGVIARGGADDPTCRVARDALPGEDRYVVECDGVVVSVLTEPPTIDGTTSTSTTTPTTTTAAPPTTS